MKKDMKSRISLRIGLVEKWDKVGTMGWAFLDRVTSAIVTFPTHCNIHWCIPGHPAELLDSVKLLLTDAKSHVFEIDPVLKSIHWRFLCQNFIHFGQVVCLPHGFEHKAFISGMGRFSNKFQELSRLTSQYFWIINPKKAWISDVFEVV